jgi:GTP cyclohydrolase I
VEALAESIVEQIVRGMTDPKGFRIWGIPRSGVPAAFAVAAQLRNYNIAARMADCAADANLIVDDLVDSGKTMQWHMDNYWSTAQFAALLDKRRKPLDSTPCVFGGVSDSDSWVVFPWETTTTKGEDTGDRSADDVVVRMLQYIGEDPRRGGLLETPGRVVKAWGEWFSGYHKNPKDLLKVFEDGAEGVEEMVLLTDIPVFSHCEHHIAPFTGVAHVAYIPNGKIVGLSKLVRVVDAFSRRLQVQERLTNQIADCLMEGLSPLGAAVVITAKHSCMSSRGVKVPNVDTTTSAMRGAFMDDHALRNEFMQLVK